MLSCAITGHRPKTLCLGGERTPICVELKEAIQSHLMLLYWKGVRQFYIGGALGVDLWAGELLLKLQKRSEYKDLQLILALPFENYNMCWEQKDKERLEQLKSNSSQIIIVCEEVISPRLCYRLRNQYMVDHADCLLAVYNTSAPRTGTGMTVRYGEKRGIPIFLIQLEKFIV